jgi:hypothetical protein
MFNDWLMFDDGLVYLNNIINIKAQQNMGALLDAISLNCHSNEDNIWSMSRDHNTCVLSHHTRVSHLTISDTHLLHAMCWIHKIKSYIHWKENLYI